MDDETPEARAVRRLLAPLVAQDHPFPADRQAEVWRRIEPQLERRRAWAPWALGGFAAAAAAVMLALSVADAPPAEPTPVAPPAQTAQAGAALGDGLAQLPSGAALDIAGAVAVAEASVERTVLRLTRGRVKSTVPKLAPGQRYRVETAAASVEVRGTVFTVEVIDGGGTRVVVDEGLVQVTPVGRPGILAVAAGEHVVIEPTLAAGADRAQGRGDQLQALDIRAALIWARPAGLEQENALLRLGHAYDAVDAAAAAEFWDRVQRTFPSGVHAEEYAFRHAAALRGAGRAPEARAAAARFRDRFPTSDRAAETRAW